MHDRSSPAEIGVAAATLAESLIIMATTTTPRPSPPQISTTTLLCFADARCSLAEGLT